MRGFSKLRLTFRIKDWKLSSKSFPPGVPCPRNSSASRNLSAITRPWKRSSKKVSCRAQRYAKTDAFNALDYSHGTAGHSLASLETTRLRPVLAEPALLRGRHADFSGGHRVAGLRNHQLALSTWPDRTVSRVAGDASVPARRRARRPRRPAETFDRHPEPGRAPVPRARSPDFSGTDPSLAYLHRDFFGRRRGYFRRAGAHRDDPRARLDRTTRLGLRAQHHLAADRHPRRSLHRRHRDRRPRHRSGVLYRRGEFSRRDRLPGLHAPAGKTADDSERIAAAKRARGFYLHSRELGDSEPDGHGHLRAILRRLSLDDAGLRARHSRRRAHRHHRAIGRAGVRRARRLWTCSRRG